MIDFFGFYDLLCALYNLCSSKYDSGSDIIEFIDIVLEAEFKDKVTPVWRPLYGQVSVGDIWKVVYEAKNEK